MTLGKFLSRSVHCICLIRVSTFVLSGIAAPVAAQPQFMVPAPSPQYMQGSGSDQTG